MKKRIALLLAALMLLTLVSCGRKNPSGLELPAIWHGGDSIWNEATLTLHEDGTFVFNFAVPCSYIARGDYTVEDDRVSCDPDDELGNHYEFQIVDGKLVFDPAHSTPLPDYTPKS